MKDSRPDTYQHIANVQSNLISVIEDLLRRLWVHDKTKLAEPELSVFNELGLDEDLKKIEYGSSEHEKRMEKLKPALEHHYKFNPHHPEHNSDGVLGMNLLDLIEMLCDWKAASLRYATPGNFEDSLKKAQERFGYSDDIARILHNTCIYLGFV